MTVHAASKSLLLLSPNFIPGKPADCGIVGGDAICVGLVGDPKVGLIGMPGEVGAPGVAVRMEAPAAATRSTGIEPAMHFLHSVRVL